MLNLRELDVQIEEIAEQYIRDIEEHSRDDEHPAKAFEPPGAENDGSGKFLLGVSLDPTLLVAGAKEGEAADEMAPGDADQATDQ